MTPKCSVVIPAYNKADYTVEAVESVLRQTYPNIECIVVDDGSTDDTFDKLTPFLKRIIYLKQHNQGVSVARNLGIEISTGEYIAFLDCDDKYSQFKIGISLTQMEEQKVDMLYNSAILIDKDGKSRGFYRPKRHSLLFRNSIMNSVVIKRKVFDKVGLFDEDLFICADWDMWLRIEEHFKIGHIDFPLTCYRI